MTFPGLVAANNLSDVVNRERAWDNLGENISAEFNDSIFWTPAAISTSLWLDAGDKSTVFSDAGTTLASPSDLVYQWNDKSGNNKHAIQGTSAARPSYSQSLLNNKQTIEFSTKTLRITNIDRPSFAAMVIQRQVNGQDIAQVTNAGDAHRGLLSNNAPAFAMFSVHNVNGGSDANNANAAVVTPSLVSVNTPTTTGNVIIDLGLGTPSSSYLVGFIAELFFYNVSISRFIVEGYLAHKWGLTGNLPSTHPYKVTPPLL